MNYQQELSRSYKECRDNGQAMNGVMSTLSSVALTGCSFLNVLIWQ